MKTTLQPKTNVPLDERSFGLLRDKARSISTARAGLAGEPGYALPLPEEVGFQLTNRCNLRCDSCFQWNETGFHRRMDLPLLKSDLDIRIVERVLEATRPAKSKVFLWGGEPLIYDQFPALMRLLTNDPRWTILSTNGMALGQTAELICPASENLACVVSLDGFEEDNDRIRGKSTFRRVMANIEMLLDLKKRGIYRGEVTISCVITPQNCRRLVEFAELFEAKGVNSVYFVFPWYIPTATADRMDEVFAGRFGWLAAGSPERFARGRASWHSYQFHLDPGVGDDLNAELRRLASRPWDIRVRLQPQLEEGDIEDFIRGSERPVLGRTRCLSVSTRLNVMPDGGVTTCKLFPEFATGNLSTQSFEEAWAGADATRAREQLTCGLMPICSKCVQLYLVGD